MSYLDSGTNPDLKFHEHCGLITATFHNMFICQFPKTQDSRFQFPWTVCPSWLSWSIGGAYNYVDSPERLAKLIELAVSDITRQQMVRNIKKFEWEFGPVSGTKAGKEDPQTIELQVLGFGPLPLKERQ